MSRQDPAAVIPVMFEVTREDHEVIRRCAADLELDLQNAGTERGLPEVAMSFVVLIPTVTHLLRVLDELRRKRIARTYVHAGSDGSVTILRDVDARDGRIVLVTDEGGSEELETEQLSAKLADLLPQLSPKES